MTPKFLQDALVESRREFTGEARSEAAPPVKSVLQAMSVADRRQLEALVHADLSAALCGDADLPDVPGHVRQALLPDCRSIAQQELEAGLFVAAGAAAQHLCFRVPADIARPARVIRGVEPGCAPDFVPTVHLEPFALGPLLFELLPRSLDDNELSGVPGVRYKQHQRSVVLFLADEPQARVSLAGVDQQHWKDAWTFAACSTREPQLWFHRDGQSKITRDEKEYLDSHGRVLHSPPALGSALFRRAGLFRGLSELRVLGGPSEQRVIWSKGASCSDIAIRLLHLLFGLPATYQESVRGSMEFAALREDVQGARATRLLLSRDEPADAELREKFREQVRGWHQNPWRVWEQQRIKKLIHRQIPEECSPAVVRTSYTGEELASAIKGITNSGQIGLDACSEPQREFQALLAVHLFNAGQTGAPPEQTGVHTLTSYNFTVSPQHDELVIFTDAPDNVINWLVPRPGSGFGIPGLRVRSCPNDRTFRLVHLPTGGQITVTSREERDVDAVEGEQRLARNWFTIDREVTRREHTALAAIPPMSTGITRLLSALVVRICAEHPQHKWALGTWSWDPLKRGKEPGGRSLGASRGVQRYLWGAHDDWELRWDGYPFPGDVAAALTDPVLGLDGVEVTGTDTAFTITLADAAIRVQHWSTLPSTGWEDEQ